MSHNNLLTGMYGGPVIHKGSNQLADLPNRVVNIAHFDTEIV